MQNFVYIKSYWKEHFILLIEINVIFINNKINFYYIIPCVTFLNSKVKEKTFEIKHLSKHFIFF